MPKKIKPKYPTEDILNILLDYYLADKKINKNNTWIEQDYTIYFEMKKSFIGK